MTREKKIEVGLLIGENGKWQTHFPFRKSCWKFWTSFRDAQKKFENFPVRNTKTALPFNIPTEISETF